MPLRYLTAWLCLALAGACGDGHMLTGTGGTVTGGAAADGAAGAAVGGAGGTEASGAGGVGSIDGGPTILTGDAGAATTLAMGAPAESRSTRRTSTGRTSRPRRS